MLKSAICKDNAVTPKWQFYYDDEHKPKLEGFHKGWGKNKVSRMQRYNGLGI